MAAGEPDLRGVEWRYLWNRSQSDASFALDFQAYPVSAASFSPAGKLVALASFDNIVTIVDPVAKTVLARLNGFFHLINCQTLAFSSDGRLLAAADRQAVNLWQTDTWSRHCQLKGEALAGEAITVAFAPGGNIVTTACAGQLAFWDSGTGRLVGRVSTSPPDIRLSSWNRTVTGQLVGRVSTSSPVSTHGHRLAYSPDGQVLALSAANEIRLWDVRSGSWTEGFTGPMDRSMCLGWSSHWLAAGNWFGDLKIWDMRTGREIVNLRAHPKFLFALAFSPDGNTLASGGGDQKIHLWNVAALEQESTAPNGATASVRLPKIATLQGHRHEVWAVGYSPDGQSLVSGGKDGSARFWSRLQPRETTRLEGARIPLHFSKDGRTLLAAGADLTLSEWDVLSRQRARVFDLSLKTNEVQFLITAPDGRRQHASPVGHGFVVRTGDSPGPHGGRDVCCLLG